MPLSNPKLLFQIYPKSLRSDMGGSGGNLPISWQATSPNFSSTTFQQDVHRGVVGLKEGQACGGIVRVSCSGPPTWWTANGRGA